MFQTCQSLDYNESIGAKPNFFSENNNNSPNNNNPNTTNYMTIKTEYTHDFNNFKEKTNFNNNFNKIAEKTTNYEDDFEEYNSEEDEEQDHDKTRLTNKASVKEIEDVVDIYKNQLNENQTAKKGGFFNNNNNLEGLFLHNFF